MKYFKKMIILFFLFPGFQHLATGQSIFEELFGSNSKLLEVEEALSKGAIENGLLACQDLLNSRLGKKQKAGAYLLLGEIHNLMDEPTQAFEAIQQANSIFRDINFQPGLALALSKEASYHFAHQALALSEKRFKEACATLDGMEQPSLAYEVFQSKAIFHSSQGDHIASMACLKKALQAGMILENAEKIESCYNQLSTNYYSIGQLDSAIIYFDKLIQFKNASGAENLSSDLSTLGMLYREKGDYLQAQTQLMQALRLGEAQADTFLIMSLCTEIAAIYAAQGIWGNVFKYSERAGELADKRGFEMIKGENLKLQAQAHQNTGNLEQALEHYEAALILFKSLNNKINIADIQLAISDLLQSEERYYPARQYAEEALRMREGTGDPLGVLNARQVLASLELKSGNPLKAIALLKSCFEASVAMNNLNGQRTVSSLLSEAYAHTAQYEQAFDWHQRYTLLNDSILSAERSRAISELDILYQTEKKDKQLIAQNADLLLKEAQIRRRNSLVTFLAIILGLGMALLGFLYSIGQKNKQLHQQKMATLQEKQEKQRIQAVLEGEENERRRIARDLHDGLGAVLATVKIRINALENDLPTIREQQSYLKAEDLIDEACHTVREISHNMVPSVLEQNGLEQAIRDLCDTISIANKLEIDFIPYGLQVEMSDQLSVTTFRIIQELLRNVIKHAEAKEVIVQLTIENNHLNLIVEDDGKGFDTASEDFIHGIGLKSVYSRVAYLEGTLHVDSKIGEGSTFTIDIPNLRL